MNKEPEYVTWTVSRVAKDLKNKFVGTVKMKGETVGHIIQGLMSRWLHEQKDKEEKEGRI